MRRKQQQQETLHAAFDRRFADFLEEKGESLGKKAEWSLWTVRRDVEGERIHIELRQKTKNQTATGAEPVVSFSFPYNTAPDRTEMMDFRRHADLKVREAGFRGYDTAIKLPYGTLAAILEGNQQAYDFVLEQVIHHTPKSPRQLEDSEDILLLAIEKAMAGAQKGHSSVSFYQILSGKRLHRKKLQSDQKLRWHDIQSPEAEPEEDAARKIGAVEMLAQLDEAIKVAKLTQKQAIVVSTILANPSVTLEDIAKAEKPPEATKEVGKEAIRQRLNHAVKKITHAAEELGFRDLAQLGQAFLARKTDRVGSK